MRQLRFIFVGSLLLGLLLQVTSSAVDKPLVPDKPTTSPAKSDITLHLYTLKEQYESGTAVDLILTIQNCSDHLTKLMDETPEMDFVLTVQDQDGKDIVLTRYGERVARLRASSVHSGRPTAIPAHDERLYKIRVNRLFDLTTIGRYTIRAQRKIAFLGEGPTLQSNEVTIAIVD